jgi:hypothetical protein
MKSVAILGCGPAGLLAAHAAAKNGCHFAIFSKRRPSHLFGSQYLHQPIPGITDEQVTVKYEMVGDPEGYRQKVYGDQWDGNVSPEDLDQAHYAWDIRSAYRKLWDLYSDNIYHCEITSERQVMRDARLETYDTVISTVPRTIWRRTGDVFESSNIWAIGDAPELGQTVPFRLEEDNLVICDGTSSVGWYRLSRVFGYSTIEWPEHAKPPISGVQKVTKPLACATKGAPDFTHMGRYGAWRKGVLTTDVYDEALKVTA